MRQVKKLSRAREEAGWKYRRKGTEEHQRQSGGEKQERPDASMSQSGQVIALPPLAAMAEQEKEIVERME